MGNYSSVSIASLHKWEIVVDNNWDRHSNSIHVEGIDSCFIDGIVILNNFVNSSWILSKGCSCSNVPAIANSSLVHITSLDSVFTPHGVAVIKDFTDAFPFDSAGELCCISTCFLAHISPEESICSWECFVVEFLSSSRNFSVIDIG